MRKSLCTGMVCLMASAALAGGVKYQPLKVKTGLWQVTESYTASGVPAGVPPLAHTTFKDCITEKNLETNPFGDPDQNCKWTVLNSTGTDMEVKGTSCALGREQGMTTNVHLKLHVVDSEHVTGTGDWSGSGNGQSMSGNATGSAKWLSSSCPAK